MNTPSTHIPDIDAVITWVDGNDPGHQQKRLLREGREVKISTTLLATANDQTRFVDNGEIRYTIASIRKFAPWIRRIFVVTDNQRPSFFTDDYMAENGIEMVDHETIFRGYEWALPTFNSRSIETVLWRIPALADRFIFFNDDFLLIDHFKPEDFFQGDKPVLRGVWNRLPGYGSWYVRINKHISKAALSVFGITRSLHLLYQMRSAQAAGFKRNYFRIPHVPHPVFKPTLVNFFNKNEAVLTGNLKYPFRDARQFSSIFLANHLHIADHKAILKDTGEVVMLNGETDYGPFFTFKFNKMTGPGKRFVCLQAMDKFSTAKKQQIYTWLDRLLGFR
ncbi:MAG: Protein of unknown function (DUF3184) [Bacteroidetes bacterium HLUCCA01]|nr:MAG: Protein of unknown function (DUF3184) [Bacteroidetes bacterium HLUCCA01]